MSNQKATHQVSKGGIKQAVFVLGGLAVASAIYAIGQPAETFPNTARFEVTSANTPVIVRGTSGAQTITVQNKGPDAATGTQALIRPSTSTGITIASVTWGASNTPCTFSSPDYTCSVGGVANNASFDITVTYNVATTATASTSVKQTEIRVKSNEFNPGSGTGETLHKVWGALAQESSASTYGAFWPGRTSTTANCNGRGTTCGTYASESSSVLGAWPKDVENPVGEYLQRSFGYLTGGGGNDTYMVNGTKNPTYNRIVADMSAYTYRRQTLSSVFTTNNRVNNRRAWEFRTHVYIPPSKTTVKLCVGADGFWVDDNAYITLSPSGSGTRTVVSTPRDAWDDNTYEVSTSGISGGGYYELIYRIVNQNGDNSDEESQGGYGEIGMAFDGDTCNVTNFDNAIEAGFPASITIANPTVDLSITKTNNLTSLTNSSSTNYIVRVTNNGPDSFTGAILKDAAATGLTKTAIACTGAAGNQCTAGTTPTIANIQSVGGYALPTLANGAFYELSITASVSATATSVSNIATIAVPTGATDSNATNNSATDTDSIRARVRIAKISNNGVGTFNFTGLSNLSNAAGTAVTTDSVTTVTSGVAVTSSQSNFSTNLNNAVLINETIPANYTLSSASCTDTNAAVSGNPATTFGSLSSNQLTIPAANIIAGADITCTFTNDLIRTDLAITKTGTSTVKAGQPVTYTLKVWNKGPTAVTDAVMNDVVPNNISGVSLQCTATGSATCGTVTPPYVSGSNTRTATGISLPVDATGNTNFATYTVKGLAYSTGSFTNTATVSSATIAESNNADNSASQATTITTDAPVTTGNAANQCLAAAATNVITPTPFTVLDADGTSASSTGTLTATVNSTGTGYGTATNGAIVLNGKMSWSYGSPIKAGSTLTFRVNGIDVAVLTTPGASSNGSASARVGDKATFTGLNGATVSQATLNIDNTYTTYSGRANFTVTLPTTITSISSAQAVYLTLNPLSPTGVTGDDFGVSIDSALQCLKPIVKIAKTSNGGTGTFAFNTLTNLSNSSGTAITTDSVTTATAGTAVTSSQTNYATALNTAVNITEAAATDYGLTAASCTDSNSAVTGNTGSFGSLSGTTLSIPAANIKYGANLTCTFNNTKQRTLTLRKTWVNARVNDAATITATGLNSFASIASTANETDTAAAQAVNVGSTVTLGENISTGVGLYNAALSCTRNSDGAAVSVTGTNLTMPDADVTCGYTNSRKSANLTLSKVWSNAKLNDAINITATGLTTFSSVANAANETDNAAAQTVYAGDNISFSETFTTGIASNYNAALACTGNTTALSGSNLTVNGADTAINCAYNNSRIAQQLNLSKTWQNGVNGHTATVTTTGSSNAASIISTAAGNNTTNGTAVSVYAGDTITLPAETFGGGATAAQYNSTLACAGGTTLTSGAVARSITISNSTTATVCTYNNSFIVPAKILVSGQVFEDNGASTGISNAYNGTQETGEVGIQDSQIALTNCSSTVIATTTTNAGGDYTFSLLPVQLPTPKFCVVQTNVSGYTSVSGTSGYTRATDTITISNSGATSYSNQNFGDARLNAVLTEDGQQTIIAGGVADYPHRLTAQSVLTVTSINQTSTQQPANATYASWQMLLYRDLNCNGKVDTGENLISASLPLSLKANEQVCLVQRVYAPATASMGAQHIGQLQASFNVSLANPTETINGSSIQRQDTTLLGSAGLSMQKMVRGVANCPSTTADTGAFATTNQAQSGGYLEYEITYRNNSNKNLIDVTIKDSVPAGTVFQNSTCHVTPVGTCTATKTGDALLWQTSGILLPTQQGKVRFCVQIP